MFGFLGEKLIPPINTSLSAPYYFHQKIYLKKKSKRFAYFNLSPYLCVMLHWNIQKYIDVYKRQVDNGRSKILADPKHIKTLNCIRCGACMNTCPVYRRSGGYSYTYFIPGPIGINLGMLKAPLHYYDNVSACSLCYSCSFVCPAKVDLAEQIYLWRQDLDKLGKADRMKRVMSGGMEFMMNRPLIFNMALKWAPLVNGMPRFLIYNGLNDWGKGREMPKFAKESFNEMWKKGKVK